MDRLSKIVLSAAVSTASVVVMAASTSSVAAAPIGDQLRMAPVTHHSPVHNSRVAEADIEATPAVRSYIPASYTVRSGDSLASIAAARLGSASDWPTLWWANHNKISNPNIIEVGQELTEPEVAAPSASLVHRALNAIPRAVTRLVSFGRKSKPVSVPVPMGGSASGIPGGALGYCIKTHEEGLSWAWGPGDGGGGYQFHEATWVEFGGAPSEYGVADAAYQNSVFAHALAAGGASNWTLYDGC
jgi:LysM repeat protein